MNEIDHTFTITNADVDEIVSLDAQDKANKEAWKADTARETRNCELRAILFRVSQAEAISAQTKVGDTVISIET